MRRLTALGGFDAKGPACFLIEIGAARLLLDLGRGPDGDKRPDLGGVGRVDAVLISHGHGDHVGSLDLLGDLGNPPVHATAPTRAISSLQRAGDLGPVQQIAGIAVETGPAGHAPGAVWMRIGGPEGVVYSGDLCREGGLWADAPLPGAAVAILDASYGAETRGLADQRAELLTRIGTGPCLLPAPPDGRGLEIARACLEAGHDIAICDKTRRAGELALDHPGWLTRAGAKALRQVLDRAAEARPDGPLDRVIIAAAAHGGKGAAAELGPRALAAGIPVILTGHVAKGSPAAEWQADGRAPVIRWNVHPNLATLRDLMGKTRARQMLAAFAPAEKRADLERALPGPWSASGVITW